MPAFLSPNCAFLLLLGMLGANALLLPVLLATPPEQQQHVRQKRAPVESSRVVQKSCPNRCYRQLVASVGPVDIRGLIEIQIEASRKKVRHVYSNPLEAFEQTCWAYRQFTTRCLRACNTSTDKTWFQEVFFNILHNYCVDYLDEVIAYWDCYQQLAPHSADCERRCSNSCRVDCVTECHRPMARSLCGTEQPIALLTRVVKAVLPKVIKSMLANGETIRCEEEISRFLRAK